MIDSMTILGADAGTIARKSSLSELKKDTLYAQAYEQLKRALMAGHMLPGSPISLRGLAEELGVSPMPVRDALNRLITQRALQLMPNRTVRVPEMTAARFAELTDVRCELETELAVCATANMDAPTLHRMREINEGMEAAAQRGDIRQFLELNYGFHFTLYKAAASEIRFPIVESLWLQSGPVLNQYLLSAGFVKAADHHEKICHGLEMRDAAAVGQAVRLDILDAANAISGALDKS